MFIWTLRGSTLKCRFSCSRKYSNTFRNATVRFLRHTHRKRLPFTIYVSLWCSLIPLVPLSYVEKHQLKFYSINNYFFVAYFRWAAVFPMPTCNTEADVKYLLLPLFKFQVKCCVHLLWILNILCVVDGFNLGLFQPGDCILIRAMCGKLISQWAVTQTLFNA